VLENRRGRMPWGGGEEGFGGAGENRVGEGGYLTDPDPEAQPKGKPGDPHG
jgi:hypothetical protein